MLENAARRDRQATDAQLTLTGKAEMKNTTSKCRQQNTPYPSKQSSWSYGMQAIDHIDPAINRAFPGHHPQFVIQSQREVVTPETFTFRRLQLGMNKEQCMAYLRISPATLRRWENGHQEIPFAAYELLRVLQENLFARMSHKAWDGWFISAHGTLVSPNFGRCEYTPERLEWVASQGTEATRLQTEVNRLKHELEVAQAENTKLREMFVNQGVVDELYAMKDRVTALVKQLGTARILPLKKTSKSDRTRRAA